MSQITTHVLDTAVGKPAKGIAISLFEWRENAWQALANGQTNADGRVSDLLNADAILSAGRYRVLFELEAYFKAQEVSAFYPYADVVFDITGDGQHYHIPLLLSPFGYSTYRGS